jgi:hypothetical protein
MQDGGRNSRGEDVENNREQINIPYIVYESAMARAERHARRLTIVIIMTVVFLFVSNGLWLYNWFQYDYISDTTETVTVDAGSGTANYIGNDGEIINGEDSRNKEEDPPKN